MRKAAFQELLMKESNILKASVLSGYSRSSYYYKPKQPSAVISNRNRRSDSTEAAGT